ncbi:hypothetical protein JEM67_00535 (plasmid) [Serratia sp. PAMC26656]|uniref:hypothetical protein n=1 Tax=Serratia sp. PAMC26656 TaxID=2775909 RepID=UPI0018F5B9D5|nr:hypothetical protein [Serratia sp. PAMC26656]MBJ7889483.1 hypothetical protein [Serratia sp. PAMC26656]
MTQERNNYLYFESDGLTGVSFVEDRHKITDGQPYGGVSSDGLSLLVKAGRKGSGGVANWFVQRITGTGNSVADNTNYPPHKPVDLNFAVSGTLRLTYADGSDIAFDDVVIGQGHADSNNWWMGSAVAIKQTAPNAWGSGDFGVYMIGAKVSSDTMAAVTVLFEVRKTDHIRVKL